MSEEIKLRFRDVYEKELWIRTFCERTIGLDDHYSCQEIADLVVLAFRERCEGEECEVSKCGKCGAYCDGEYSVLISGSPVAVCRSCRNEYDYDSLEKNNLT